QVYDATLPDQLSSAFDKRVVQTAVRLKYCRACRVDSNPVGGIECCICGRAFSTRQGFAFVPEGGKPLQCPLSCCNGCFFLSDRKKHHGSRCFFAVASSENFFPKKVAKRADAFDSIHERRANIVRKCVEVFGERIPILVIVRVWS